MREIKFRGYDPNNEEWKYGSLIQYPNGNCVIVEFDTDGNELSYDAVPETVGQFTDLRDKAGAEIYEGDVVKGVGYRTDSCISDLIPFDVIGVVSYHEEYQTLGIRTAQGALHIEVAIKGEVIGNIHDSPQLLEKK